MGLFDWFKSPSDASPKTARATRWSAVENSEPLPDASDFARREALKAQKDFAAHRVGITKLDPYPSTDIRRLISWHRRNELVYACIQKKAEAAQDPELIVQRRKRSGEWEVERGHPLRRLMLKPNPKMDGAGFMASWLVSEDIAGSFYVEIVRSPAGFPVELWPLDPAKVKPLPNADKSDVRAYEWRDGNYVAEIPAKDMLVSHLPDLCTPHGGLAPLAVAVGSAEADTQQTDFVRAFFKNSGVPSGIIKLKGRRLPPGEKGEEEAAGIARRWMRRYGWGGQAEKGPAVLDENADYQQIGVDIKGLDNQTLRAITEARICMCFGVPPLLAGAFVGLLYLNQRAAAFQAQRDFWANKLSPTFKRMRGFLTWNLLPEWENPELIAGEKVRCFWDMGNVMALQEDLLTRARRASESFRSGAITLNQYEEIVGLPITPGGGYYLRPVNRIPVNQEVVEVQLEAAAAATRAAIDITLTGTRTATAVPDVADPNEAVEPDPDDPPDLIDEE